MRTRTFMPEAHRLHWISLGALAVALGAVFPAAPVEAQELSEDSVIEGEWQGALELPSGQSLRLVVHLERAEDGTIGAQVDSPDQGAIGIPVERAEFADGRLELDLPGIGARYEATLEEPDRLAGTWHQGGGALPLELRRGEEAAALNRPQEPTPPFPYGVEELRFGNPEASIHLAGTLTLPEGSGPFPAVVLVTGSGPQNRDETIAGHRPFLVLADHLTRNGIAVLRYDDRGVGDSEGDFAAATARDFASDATAAVAHLRSRPEVDREAVGLVGHSEGGLIAAMVAAEPGSVDFIVSLAGTGLPGEEILLLQGAAIARAMGATGEAVERQLAAQQRVFAAIRDEEEATTRRQRAEEALRALIEEATSEERSAMGLTAGGEDQWVQAQVNSVSSPWFHFFLAHDPREDLRRVRIPVLALIGEKDLQVTPAENLPAIEAALADAGNSDVTLLELPGLNHLFQTAETGAPAEYVSIEETFSPRALEIIADWIAERFGAP